MEANKTLEQILQESRDLHTWIFFHLDGVPLPKTRRCLLAISAFDVVLTILQALQRQLKSGHMVLPLL